MEEKKSSFATVCIVLGVVALCTSFIPFFNNLSFAIAIMGIICAIVSLIKKASIKKSIVGIIICIVACVAVVNAQKSLSDSLNEVTGNLDGSNTEEILKNYVDVTLGNFEVIDGEYITETKLPVTIKNKSSEQKSFDIQIEAVDSEGNRITEGYIYANDLSAGQSQVFNVFEYVESAKLELMKNATFNIVEVSMY